MWELHAKMAVLEHASLTDKSNIACHMDDYIFLKKYKCCSGTELATLAAGLPCQWPKLYQVGNESKLLLLINSFCKYPTLTN